MFKNRVKVSKFLSFILRHGPHNYGLSLDKHGLADFDNVFKILKNRFPGIEVKDIKLIVENDPKKRFQIKEGKIRARYGHSVEVEPLGQSRGVPDVLYHGTSPKNLDSILKEGIKPGRRKFVHLSLTIEEAWHVGKRKASKPLILIIDSKKAKKEALLFWKEENIYLTKEVPPQYISVYE
ncbi:MAG: RNA 2'-phosphotransferase [Candidatus Aminicenantes bacterium]|nr:RNA 2'-phosphotransferase [Candidatus Aminicenantes bacterium]